MAALAKDRSTKFFGEYPIPGLITFPVKGATLIHGGALVATDATGMAAGATVATTLKCWGIATSQVDNTLGADAALLVEVRFGVALLDNGTSTDALAAADVGKPVYAIDDHTVGKTDGTGTRSIAGIFYGLDPVTGQAMVLLGGAIPGTV